MLPVAGPGKPVWSYKVIHSLWLPLLVLVCMGRTKLHLSTGFTITGPGDRQKSQGTPRSTSVRLHLPAMC